MKLVVVDTHYRARCLRIQPALGPAIRLTDFPRDIVMSNGARYLTSSGYEFTGYQANDSLNGDVVDLEGIAGYAGIDRATVASGAFDGARAYLFAVDWRSPVEDAEQITCSVLGKVTLQDDRYRIEEVSLIDTLGQSVGITVSPSCRHTFGDAGCGMAVPQVTGTITDVGSAYIIRDSARGEAADWFGWGTLRFTSGANAGLRAQEIKSYAADGTIEIYEAFYYPVAVGDAYVMTPGCRKRLEDCRDKWNNVVNPVRGGFGGFPNVPTSSTYAQVGRKR